MQVSPHFSLREFGDPPEAYRPAILQVANALEVIRDGIGHPLYLTSGWRSPEHNAAVGGARNSDHIRGLAVDYEADGWKAYPLAVKTKHLLDAAGVAYDQIIYYVHDRHVHLGLGLRMRRMFFQGDR